MNTFQSTLTTHNAHALSEEEIAEVTRLLSQLEPGYLPFELFLVITRLVTTPIIEIVPLRTLKAGSTEILLLPGEADDPYFRHTLHAPGTVVRASDTPGSFDDSFQRILTKELAGTKTSQPVFVKRILHHSGRGMESSQIYWVEVQDKALKGTFYDTDALPSSLMQSQLDFIPDAIAHYKINNEFHKST